MSTLLLSQCWSWSPLSLFNSLCSGHPRMRNLQVKVYVFSCDLKKNLYHWFNLSQSISFFIYFAPEAFVSWIGFSRSNVFSAYLIRSWNRVMKFTGLCSLDLKYKWAKHSFCFTPCQTRVLFLSLLFISFQWIATAQSNCKTHRVFFCITETCKWLLRDIIM